MSDAELRTKVEYAREEGFKYVTIEADDLSRLLDLLPPADDGEPVTAECLERIKERPGEAK